MDCEVTSHPINCPVPPWAATSPLPSPLTREMSALPCTSKHKSKYPWGALQKCRGMSSPRTLAIPSVCPNAGVSLDITYFKLVAAITSRPSLWPSKDEVEMLGSQDQHKRPHLGDLALSSAKSLTKSVHPSPLLSHSSVAQSERHQGDKRSKKKKIFFKKNPW